MEPMDRQAGNELSQMVADQVAAASGKTLIITALVMLLFVYMAGPALLNALKSLWDGVKSALPDFKRTDPDNRPLVQKFEKLLTELKRAKEDAAKEADEATQRVKEIERLEQQAATGKGQNA